MECHQLFSELLCCYNITVPLTVDDPEYIVKWPYILIRYVYVKLHDFLFFHNNVLKTIQANHPKTIIYRNKKKYTS